MAFRRPGKQTAFAHDGLNRDAGCGRREASKQLELTGRLFQILVPEYEPRSADPCEDLS